MKFKKKLILFDLDGVIIDSRDNMQHAWNEVKKKHELDIKFENYFQLIGKPFREILKELGIKRNKKQIESDFSIFSSSKIHEIPFFENVEKTLTFFKKSKKHKVGIVTSKDFHRTNAIISRLPKFDIVSSPEKELKGKPFPDQLLFAMAHTNCKPSETIYIGDMAVDECAAERAGIDFLYAKWGYGNLKNKNHLKKISDLMEIIN